MCCCGKPTINGQPGYSWDGQHVYAHPVVPPALAEGDEMLYDEPGRCGGLDCHSHHFRLVKGRYGYALLVRHGIRSAALPRCDLGVTARYMIPSLAALDSNARFWLFHTLYSVQSQAARDAASRREQAWRTAAAEKRVKTRKVRGGVKVWIEPPPSQFAAADRIAV